MYKKPRLEVRSGKVVIVCQLVQVHDISEHRQLQKVGATKWTTHHR